MFRIEDTSSGVHFDDLIVLTLDMKKNTNAPFFDRKNQHSFSSSHMQGGKMHDIFQKWQRVFLVNAALMFHIKSLFIH